MIIIVTIKSFCTHYSCATDTKDDNHLVQTVQCFALHADAATSPNRLSSDRDASKMQLMASMSSVGGGDSLQDVWALMESGLSPRTATPRWPNADSMFAFCVLCYIYIFPITKCCKSENSLCLFLVIYVDDCVITAMRASFSFCGGGAHYASVFNILLYCYFFSDCH